MIARCLNYWTCFEFLILQVFYQHRSMTAITKDQISQQIFEWQDLSRGYRGGRFDSSEICVFDEAGEKETIEFSIREYTSDHEDLFGVCAPAWRILVFCRGTKQCAEVDKEEYDIMRTYELGADYTRWELAMEFCEYILASYLEHQNLSRLPYINFDPVF